MATLYEGLVRAVLDELTGTLASVKDADLTALRQALVAARRIYTPHGHQLRFFKGLKAQGEQRIQDGPMLRVRLTQARHDRCSEGRKVLIVLGIQALLLDELPQSLNQVEIGRIRRQKTELDV